MKGFSKQEIFWISIIFLFLFAISFPNFALSIRRARDQTRRDDMGSLENSLNEYYADFGVFPKSSEKGEMVACVDPSNKVEVNKKGGLMINLVPCAWGSDSLADLTPGSTKVYYQKLPLDPTQNKGDIYVYISNGARFQLLSSLEGVEEAGYDASIAARKITCGTRTCNMGRSYGVPLNKSISEYEEELNNAIQQKKKK
ncbi:MAG TPA: hypothetical protein VFI61_01095 [Patescibacteria group bacterium]|nr:hypothetical protein [Patescibacteria group bacterium]